jgi:hypothetical protein
MRWGYRGRQFLLRLRARRAAVDLAVAQRVLNAAGYRLFAQMPVGDQLHALAVLATLEQEGTPTAHLAQAALLHDEGKAAGGLTLAHRTLIVLLEWLRPPLLARLGGAASPRWRRPFYVHLHHGALGAERCAAAGCAPEVVALVRHHGEKAVPEALPASLREAWHALREADERC